jgi:hypothetical protein
VDVDVHAVLGRLGLGNALEQELRAELAVGWQEEDIAAGGSDVLTLSAVLANSTSREPLHERAGSPLAVAPNRGVAGSVASSEMRAEAR